MKTDRLKIPAGLGDDVEGWSADDVEVFFGENKKQYHIDEDDIQEAKRLKINGITLLRFDETVLISWGILPGGAYSICKLAEDLRVVKGLVAPGETPLLFSPSSFRWLTAPMISTKKA